MERMLSESTTHPLKGDRRKKVLKVDIEEVLRSGTAMLLRIGYDTSLSDEAMCATMWLPDQ